MSNSSLTTFDFALSLADGAEIDQTVRVVTIKGDPWFVAADVCRALGMDLTGGTGQWLRGINDDERQTVNRTSRPDVFSGRRTSTAVLITESGLYKLVLRSNKPQARPFQDWVTRVVLPAIRKDGMYVAGEEKVVSGEKGVHRLNTRGGIASVDVVENRIV